MNEELKEQLEAIIVRRIDNYFALSVESERAAVALDIAEHVAAAFRKLTAEAFEGEPVYLFVGDAS